MADDAQETLDKELNKIPRTEEDFEEFGGNEEITQISDFEKRDSLNTHSEARSNLVGSITSLGKSKSSTTLQTTEEMKVDSLGLIHNGFIYSGAEYAAAIAINEENLVIISSKVKFLAPAKSGDLIEFKAFAKFEDSRKREIKVIGEINEIKIFEGFFQAVLLENHILKTKIKNIDSDYHAH